MKIRDRENQKILTGFRDMADFFTGNRDPIPPLVDPYQGTIQILPKVDLEITGICQDDKARNDSDLDGLQKCIPSEGNWEKHFHKVELILSTVGTIGSIISLCLTITTYLMFKQLMTIPGKNLVSLCLSILISDMIILITNYYVLPIIMCKIFGALLHWSSLANQLWGLTIVFDLYKTFRSNIMAQHENRFKIYASSIGRQLPLSLLLVLQPKVME